MKHKYQISLTVESDPVVEIDSPALAAYVRFSKNPVVKTQVLNTKGCVVTLDQDREGRVVGIEVVGLPDFTVTKMIEVAGIQPLPPGVVERVRYVPSGLVEV